MAWVEKAHNAHPVPTPCYVQGRQPADQAAQSHIQPGLECLQGWGIHSLLGQPVQCVTALWGKNFLLTSNLNLPCLSFKPFPLVLSPSTLINSHFPSYLYTSFKYWKTTVRTDVINLSDAPSANDILACSSSLTSPVQTTRLIFCRMQSGI